MFRRIILKMTFKNNQMSCQHKYLEVIYIFFSLFLHTKIKITIPGTHIGRRDDDFVLAYPEADTNNNCVSSVTSWPICSLLN